MRRSVLIGAVIGLSLAVGLILGELNGPSDEAVFDLASREGFFHPDCDMLKPAQKSSQACTMFLRSESLSEDVPVRVIVPPGYPAKGPYAVVYFLHGRESSMLPDRPSMVESLGFNELMAVNQAQQETSWILVAPQDRRGHDYWMNGAKNGRKWNDFLAWELPATIEQSFPVKPRPCARLIAGISMGAYGAFYHFFQHPLQYAGFAAHSPLFRTNRTEVEINGHDPAVFGIAEGELNKSLLPRLYRHEDIHLGRPMWIDIGDHDQLAINHYKKTFDFIREVAEREPKAKVSIFEGEMEDHSFPYWKKHLPAALEWYSTTLAEACNKPSTEQQTN